MKNKNGGTIQIAGDSGDHLADVDLINGIKRLRTDATVTVEEIFGQDPFPDSYFEIVNTGDINDTWRIQVAGITDPTASERTLPAVDYTFTVTASEADDEIALRDAIIDGLNNDTDFEDAFLKAQKAKDLAVIHITSTLRSMSNEYYERPNSGDFSVTVSGTADVIEGYDNLISRGKSTSLARDPDSPHRLGILGISGSVNVQPGLLGNLIARYADAGGGVYDMAVDGDPTPVIYYINSDADFDLFFNQGRLHGLANGIKYGQFLNLNHILTNGILIEAKSDDVSIEPIYLKSTDDIKALWSSPNAFDLDVQSGGDHFLGTWDLGLTPFVIRKSGTFGAGNDDYVRVTIQDDISSLTSLYFTAHGFKRDA